MASDQSQASIPIPLSRGTTVLIVSWALAGVSSLFVFARAGIRSKFSRVESSDTILPIALVLVLSQTVCIHLSVDRGLGQPYDSLKSGTIGSYYEIIYWAQLLYILSLGATKLVFILHAAKIGHQQIITTTCNAAAAVVCLGTFGSLFASAFQCSLPRPWQVTGQRCIDLYAFWLTFAGINVATDFVITAIAVVCACALAAQKSSRVFVGSLFTARLLVPAFCGVQIYYLIRSVSVTDPTFDIVPLQIWTQVVLNVSIITTCLPSLTIFLPELTPRRPSRRGRSVISRGVDWTHQRHDKRGDRFSSLKTSRISKGSKTVQFEENPDSDSLTRRYTATISATPTTSNSRWPFWSRLFNQKSGKNKRVFSREISGPVQATIPNPLTIPAPILPHPVRFDASDSITLDLLTDYNSSNSQSISTTVEEEEENEPKSSFSPYDTPNSERHVDPFSSFKRWSYIIRGGHSHSTSTGTTDGFTPVVPVKNHRRNMLSITSNSPQRSDKTISAPLFICSTVPVAPQRSSSQQRPATVAAHTRNMSSVSTLATNPKQGNFLMPAPLAPNRAHTISPSIYSVDSYGRSRRSESLTSTSKSPVNSRKSSYSDGVSNGPPSPVRSSFKPSIKSSTGTSTSQSFLPQNPPPYMNPTISIDNSTTTVPKRLASSASSASSRPSHEHNQFRQGVDSTSVPLNLRLNPVRKSANSTTTTITPGPRARSKTFTQSDTSASLRHPFNIGMALSCSEDATAGNDTSATVSHPPKRGTVSFELPERSPLRQSHQQQQQQQQQQRSNKYSSYQHHSSMMNGNGNGIGTDRHRSTTSVDKRDVFVDVELGLDVDNVCHHQHRYNHKHNHDH